MTGLPFFVPLYLPQFEWTIYGPRGVAKTLQETLAGQMQHDYFPVRLGDVGSHAKYLGLSEDTREGFWLGEETASTSIKVTTKYLNHSVLTLGYKLEEFAQIPQESQEEGGEPSRKRASKGVTVAYITDHEPFDHTLTKGGFIDYCIRSKSEPDPTHHLSPDQSHVEFFRDVDILFHDCQYLFSEYSPDSAMSKEYWGHSTVEYVVEVAFYANVKKVLLFHHDPQRSDDKMDDLLKLARNKAMELEEQYGGDFMTSNLCMDGKRVPLEVDAAKEGDSYELDPFVFMEGDDFTDVTEDGTASDASVISSDKLRGSLQDSEKRVVLLGLYQTKAGPILDVLKNSDHAFDAKVFQSSNDILRFVEEKQPSVIVLDEHLFGCTGFEVCEEIRSMKGYGEHVILIVIASNKDDSSLDDVSTSSESKEQQIADRLRVEDYILGPFSPSYLLTRIQVSLLRMPLRWRRAPFSSREAQRLITLQGTGLLDSDPEERFDRITRLCSTMFDVPISLVSLVTKDKQWFKSNVGLPGATETPRDHAFCAHAILEDGIMVVPDALQDARFADNPLVEGAPNVRFYAGCPIRVSSKDSNERYPIGTLCVIDSKPRDLKEEELRALKDLGRMVEREVELGQQDNKTTKRRSA